MSNLRLILVLTSTTACLAFGCGGEDVPGPEGDVPLLTPEPAGAPAETVDESSAQLGCMGRPPAPPDKASLELLGWVRALGDPDNADNSQPAAEVEAFDQDGISVGTSFSNTANGRVEVVVPVDPEVGFLGRVVARVDGFLDWYTYSSRPYASDELAAWAWMVTEADADAIFEDAGVTRQPGTGIIVGAVHDCEVFGVPFAVVQLGSGNQDVVYFDDPDYRPPLPSAGRPSIRAEHFTISPGATFTQRSGRFAIANVPAGTTTVEAYGRREAGGPLELYGRVEVEVTAGAITAVDLQPRVGIER